MKRKFLSLFAALALAVTASAQLRFGEEYVRADFDDPATTPTKVYASWYTNESGSDGRIRLNKPLGATEAYAVIALEGGKPASVDFGYAVWTILASGVYFAVEESADKQNWDKVADFDKPKNLNTWHDEYNWPVKETTRYLRVRYKGTYDGDFRKIKVKALHESATISLNVDKSGLDFGQTDSTVTSVDSTITVTWSDLGNIHAYFPDGENADSIFSVKPAVISSEFGSGSGDFTVSANPKGLQPGVYTANLYVEGVYSDDEDWRERIVPLKVVVRGEQEITWYGSTEDSTEVHLCIEPRPTIERATTNPEDRSLTYESDNRNVIFIYNNRPYVNQSHITGDAYVTARQAGDEIYKPAQLTRHFFVHDATEFDTIVTSICEGEPLVIGSYSWNIENDSIFDTDTTTFYGSKMRLHMDVTVQKAKDSVSTVAICPSELPYQWRGQSLDETGTYYDTDYYTTGCDSVLYTLNLTIHEVVNDSVLTTTVCESELPYQWRGKELYTSGTYKDTDSYATGCDSVWYTLNLTVNPSYDVTDDDITLCEGEEFSWNDQYIESVSLEDAGDYTYYGSTVAGCDSTVHVTLVVNQKQETTETRTMTYGDAFVWNGVNYANKDVDTYKDTIVLSSTVTGCDSLVILNLTINKAPQDIFWNLNDENDMFIGNSLTIEAIATGGSEVILEVSDGTAIEVKGKDVIAVASGKAKLKATAAGNTNYEAAEPIEATFTVTDITALKLLFGNSKDAVKKVLYEGHIYIMTNGKIFNAEGVLIQ